MTPTTFTHVRQDTFLNKPLDDLLHGHSVIIAARWMLVAAALMLVLYRPQSVTDVTIGVLSILGIAIINFWLHTRPLTNRPGRTWRAPRISVSFRR